MRALAFIFALLIAQAASSSSWSGLHIGDGSFRKSNRGSLQGGTRITITGQGFLPWVHSYSIRIGPSSYDGASCKLQQQLSSSIQLVCDTMKPFVPLIGAQPVRVWENASPVPSTCTSDCTFTFDPSRTPKVTGLWPRSVRGGDLLTVYGNNFDNVFKQSHADFAEVTLGAESTPATAMDFFPNNRCPLEAIINGTTGATSITTRQFTCRVPDDIPSGTHTIDVRFLMYGSADPDTTSGKVVTVYPTIRSVSPPTAAISGGRLITIRGSGFGRAPAQNIVSLYGIPCPVEVVDHDGVICRAGALARAPQTYEAWMSARAKGGYLVRSWREAPARSAEALFQSEAYLFPEGTSGTGTFARPTGCPGVAGSGACKSAVIGDVRIGAAGDEIAVSLSCGKGTDCDVWTTALRATASPNKLRSFWWRVAHIGADDVNRTVIGERFTVPKGSARFALVSVGDTAATASASFVDANGRRLTPTAQNYWSPADAGFNSTAPTPVRVEVGGVVAIIDPVACHTLTDEDACRFDYTSGVATVVAVNPERAQPGASINVTGTGFDPNANVVEVGGVPCAVTASSTTSVTCVLDDETPGGARLVTVLVPSRGIATGTVVVDVEPTLLSGPVPDVGGSTGGRLVAASAKGIDARPGHTTLAFGGAVCDPKGVSVDGTTIRCATPAGTGTVPVTAAVLSVGRTEVAATLGYAPDADTRIDGVAPAQIASNGGDITIFGGGFPASGRDGVAVTVGGTPCHVVTCYVGAIRCTLPRLNDAGMKTVVVTVKHDRTTGAVLATPRVVRYYGLDIIPVVDKVSPSSIAVAGGTVRISGAGLSYRPGALNVTIGGSPCVIERAQPSYVDCRVSAQRPGFGPSNAARELLLDETFGGYGPNQNPLGLVSTVDGAAIAEANGISVLRVPAGPGKYVVTRQKFQRPFRFEARVLFDGMYREKEFDGDVVPPSAVSFVVLTNDPANPSDGYAFGPNWNDTQAFSVCAKRAWCKHDKYPFSGSHFGFGAFGGRNNGPKLTPANFTRVNGRYAVTVRADVYNGLIELYMDDVHVGTQSGGTIAVQGQVGVGHSDQIVDVDWMRVYSLDEAMTVAVEGQPVISLADVRYRAESDSPMVSYLEATSVVTSGTQVCVVGTGFSPDANANTIVIGGVRCTDGRTVEDVRAVVRAPPKRDVTDSESSDDDADEPSIFDLPSASSAEPEVVSRRACCRAPALPNGEQPVIVEVDGVGLSAAATDGPSGVTVQTAALRSLLGVNSDNRVALGGATLTITGEGFGTTPVANDVRVGGVSATVLSASGTKLVVRIPRQQSVGAAGVSHEIAVTVSGVTATPSASARSFVVYDAALTPAVKSVERTDDGKLRVGGELLDDVTVVVGSTPCATVSSTASEIICVPGSAAGDWDSQVRVSKGDRGYSAPFSRARSILEASTVFHAYPAGGALVTVEGIGLPVRDKCAGLVTVGGVTCPVVSCSYVRVVCATPAGALGAVVADGVAVGTVVARAPPARLWFVPQSGYGSPVVAPLVALGSAGGPLGVTFSPSARADTVVTLASTPAAKPREAHVTVTLRASGQWTVSFVDGREETFGPYERGDTFSLVRGADDEVVVLRNGWKMEASAFPVAWPVYAASSGTAVALFDGRGLVADAMVVPLRVTAAADMDPRDIIHASINGSVCHPTSASAGRFDCLADARALVVANSTDPFEATVVTRYGTAVVPAVVAPFGTPTPSVGSPAGGFTVTLNGGGFGLELDDNEVHVGAARCAVSVVSATELVCRVPPTAALSAGRAAVSVTVRRELDGMPAWTRYVLDGAFTLQSEGRPQVASVSPATVSVGDLLTVTGTGLDVGPVVVDVGGSVCLFKSATATSITCTIRAVGAGVQPVVVNFAGFGVAAPTIPNTAHSVIVALAVGGVSAPPAGGLLLGGSSTLTLTGSSGIVVGDVARADGAVLCEVVSVSDTSAVCRGVRRSTGSGPVTATITKGGQTVSFATTLAAADGHPVATSVAPRVITPGATVTITGTDLGNAVGIRIGAKTCTATAKSATSVSCRAPTGLPGGPVFVAADFGTRGASHGVDAVVPLEALSISPRVISLGGGVPITITGSNFGDSSSVRVLVGGNIATLVSVTATQIVFKAPPASIVGTASSAAVVVERTEGVWQHSAPLGSFTYQHIAAVVTGVTSLTFPVGGGRLSVSGEEFPDGAEVVVVDGTSELPCRTVTANATMITCDMPAHGPASLPIRVRVGPIGYARWAVPDEPLVTYRLALYGISEGSGSAQGGHLLVLRGVGFEAGTVSVKIGSPAVGYSPCVVVGPVSGGVSCRTGRAPFSYQPVPVLPTSPPPVPSSDVLDVIIEVQLPRTPLQVGEELLLSLRDQRDTRGLHTVVCEQCYRFIAQDPTSDPVVTAVSPPSVVAGTTLTISGERFVAGSSADVRVGDAACLNAVVTSTTITCTLDGHRAAAGREQRLSVGFGSGDVLQRLACPADSAVMDCRGRCYKDSQCTFGGTSTCSGLQFLVFGDQFCHSNNGTDYLAGWFEISNDNVADFNCPMHHCEGGDCDSAVTACGQDPVLTLVVAPSVTRVSVDGDASRPLSRCGGASIVVEGGALNGSTIAVGGNSCVVDVEASTPDRVVCYLAAWDTAAAAASADVVASVAGVRATCAPGSVCTITFADEASQPMLVSVAPPRSGLPFVATGTALGSGSIRAELVQRGVARPLTVDAFSADSATLRGGALLAGPAALRLYGSSGAACGATAVTVSGTINSVVPSVGSTAGGTIVAIVGSGFGSTKAEAAAVLKASLGGTTFEVDDVEYRGSVHTLYLRTTPGSATGDISIVADGASFSCTSCAFSQLPSATPTVTSHPTSIDAANARALSFTGTSLGTAGTVTITVGAGPCVPAHAWGPEGGTCSLVGVPSGPGAADVVVHVSPFGNAAGTPYSASVALSASAVPQSGSRGGFHDVTVDGISFPADVARLSVIVGNRPCAVVSSSGGAITCRTSPASSATPNVALPIHVAVRSADLGEVLGGGEAVVVSAGLRARASGGGVESADLDHATDDDTATEAVAGPAADAWLQWDLGAEVIIHDIVVDADPAFYPLTVAWSHHEVTGGTTSILSQTTLSAGAQSYAPSAVTTARYIRVATNGPRDGLAVKGIVVRAKTSLSTEPAYSYSDSETPQVTSVSPRYGSTLGGTRVTVRGTGLQGVTTILVGDTACEGATAAADGTWAECVTPLQTVPFAAASGKQAVVALTSKGAASCVAAADPIAASAGGAASHGDHGSSDGGMTTYSTQTAACDFEYLDTWSAKTTWNNGPLPVEGDSVAIAKGQTIMLDVSPPRLHLLVIEGTLIVSPDVDVHLQATYVMIRGGHLLCGTETNPHPRKFKITLYGDALTPEIPMFGSKVLALRMGRLDLHGMRRRPSFTKLHATAGPGATRVQLQGEVNWRVGDSIVIAPTSFYKERAEERRVTRIEQVDVDGAVTTILSFDHPLEFHHAGRPAGDVDCYRAGSHDDGEELCYQIAAEVGVITRDIVVEGDPDTSVATQIGGHLFVMTMGDDDHHYARVDSVEFRNCGQKSRLGRYCTHFHMSGPQSQSYMRNSAMHHSNNRAVAIHGVTHLTVTGNVAYNVKGHTFFTEDGDERFNTIAHNLAIDTIPSTSLLNTDTTPANFWIVNPHNYVYGNTAAGSSNYGFWYRGFEHVTGLSASDRNCPVNAELLLFENNTAHSNGKYGLRIFETYEPLKNGYDCPKKNDAVPVAAHFNRLLSYRNKLAGVAMGHDKVGNVGFVKITRGIFVDNGIPGAPCTTEVTCPSGVWSEHTEMRSSWKQPAPNGDDDGPGVYDSVFVGHTNTDNVTIDPEYAPFHTKRRGVSLPMSQNFRVMNTTFVNYYHAGRQQHYAVEPVPWGERMSLCNPWSFEADFAGISFIKSPERLHMRFIHHGIINDMDGTFTGLPPTDDGVSMSQALAYSPLLDPRFCSRSTILGSDPHLMRCGALNPDAPQAAARDRDAAVARARRAQVSADNSAPVSQIGIPESHHYRPMRRVTGPRTDVPNPILLRRFDKDCFAALDARGSQGGKYDEEANPVHLQRVCEEFAPLIDGDSYLYAAPTSTLLEADFNHYRQPEIYRFTWETPFANESTFWRMQYQAQIDHFVADLGAGLDNRVAIFNGTSMSTLVEAAALLNDTLVGVCTVDDNNTVTVLSRRHAVNQNPLTVSITAARCPAIGCAVEAAMPLFVNHPCYKWSDWHLWAEFLNGTLISATSPRRGLYPGDDVQIGPKSHVCLDEASATALPRGGLGRLIVRGRLVVAEYANSPLQMELEGFPRQANDFRKTSRGGDPLVGSREEGATTVTHGATVKRLIASEVLVHGGEIYVGDATHPYPAEKAFELELTGDPSDANSVFGTRSLGLTYGQVRLHGAVPTNVMTHLAASAAAGATTITVSGDVSDWPAGSRLVVTTSGFNKSHTEVRTIASVADKVITLTAPLTYAHLGGLVVDGVKAGDGTNDPLQRSVDMSAEVGLLTRNVRIVGNADAYHSENCKPNLDADSAKNILQFLSPLGLNAEYPCMFGPMLRFGCSTMPGCLDKLPTNTTGGNIFTNNWMGPYNTSFYEGVVELVGVEISHGGQPAAPRGDVREFPGVIEFDGLLEHPDDVGAAFEHARALAAKGETVGELPQDELPDRVPPHEAGYWSLKRSRVEGCVLFESFSAGISVRGAQAGLEIADNIILGTYDAGIRVQSPNNVIRGNLVANAEIPALGCTTWPWDKKDDCRTAAYIIEDGNMFVDNVAAGVAPIGIRTGNAGADAFPPPATNAGDRHATRAFVRPALIDGVLARPDSGSSVVPDAVSLRRVVPTSDFGADAYSRWDAVLTRNISLPLRSTWARNVVHSARVGVMLSPKFTDDESVITRGAGGVTVYHALENAFISYWSPGNVTLWDIAVAESTTGVLLNMLGGPGYKMAWHKGVIENAFIAGTRDGQCPPSSWYASTNNDNVRGAMWPYEALEAGLGMTGIMLGSASMEMGDSMKGEPLKRWAMVDGDPVVNHDQWYSDVHFARWPAGCPFGSGAISNNFQSRDTFPLTHFTDSTASDSGAGLFKWYVTKDLPNTWETFVGSELGVPVLQEEGDASLHALIHDTTRSLIPLPGNASFGEAWGTSSPMLTTNADRYFPDHPWPLPIPVPVPQEMLPEPLYLADFAYPGQCVRDDNHNGYSCGGLEFRTVVLESLDEDFMGRRVGPVTVCESVTAPESPTIDPSGRPLCLGRRLDLFTGPVSHPLKQGLRLQTRRQRYHLVVAANRNYTVDFTGTNPFHMAIYPLDFKDDETVVFRIRYANPERLTVRIDGLDQRPNWGFGPPPGGRGSGALFFPQRTGVSTQPPALTRYPRVGDPTGTQYFDRGSGENLQKVNVQHLVLGSGVRSIELVTTPIVQVSMTLAITTEQFFADETNFVKHLAFVLGIDPLRIKVPVIAAGSVVILVEIESDPAAVAQWMKSVDINDDSVSVVTTADGRVGINVRLLGDLGNITRKLTELAKTVADEGSSDLNSTLGYTIVAMDVHTKEPVTGARPRGPRGASLSIFPQLVLRTQCTGQTAARYPTELTARLLEELFLDVDGRVSVWVNVTDVPRSVAATAGLPGGNVVDAVFAVIGDNATDSAAIARQLIELVNDRGALSVDYAKLSSITRMVNSSLGSDATFYGADLPREGQHPICGFVSLSYVDVALAGGRSGPVNMSRQVTFEASTPAAGHAGGAGTSNRDGYFEWVGTAERLGAGGRCCLNGISVCHSYGTLGDAAVETCFCRCNYGYSGLACEKIANVTVSGMLGDARYPAQRCADVLWCRKRATGVLPQSGEYHIRYADDEPATPVACSFTDSATEPGAWTPLVAAPAGSAGILALGGGWEQFFADGPLNASASTTVGENFLRRFPASMTSAHELLMTCGAVGVVFTVPQRGLQYLQGDFASSDVAWDANAEGWHPIHSVRVPEGMTAPTLLPDRIYIGPGGVILAANAVGGVVVGLYGGTSLFGPLPDPGFDLCNGLPLSADARVTISYR